MKRKIYGFRKGLLSMVALLGLTGVAAAQVGVGTTAPDPSAQLEVRASDKGLLVPRVSATGNVSNPANGLLIYKTGSDNGFYYNEGTSVAPTWRRLAHSGNLPDASASIIPIASGTPVTMTTVLGGLNGTVSAVGFGSNAPGITISGGVIDLTGSGGTMLNQAFSVPQDGTITSMAAYFSTANALSLVGSTITIYAQLFQSSTPDNIFTAVPGAMVTMAPAFTGVMATGTITMGRTTGLSIPVMAGTRLLWVVSSNVTAGIDVATTIHGYASGGLSILAANPQ